MGSRRLSPAIPTGKADRKGGWRSDTDRARGGIKKGGLCLPFYLVTRLELAVEHLFGLDCAVRVNGADDVDTGCRFGKTDTVEIVNLYADHFG